MLYVGDPLEKRPSKISAPSGRFTPWKTQYMESGRTGAPLSGGGCIALFFTTAAQENVEL